MFFFTDHFTNATDVGNGLTSFHSLTWLFLKHIYFGRRAHEEHSRREQTNDRETQDPASKKKKNNKQINNTETLENDRSLSNVQF